MKISTEANILGVDDTMGMMLWIRYFLEAQGFDVDDCVFNQENMSEMLIEKWQMVEQTANKAYTD